MTCDFLIIGAGIIGLSLAYKLKEQYPNSDIIILEKESSLAKHASGRNSGVLHAGFYYSANSLKAKFSKEGNRALKEFAKEYKLALNECGKVVVAQNEEELKTLYELKQRGDRNGVDVSIIDEEEASKIDSNIKTYKKALYCPTTATIDPKEVLNQLRLILVSKGVKILFNTPWEGNLGNNNVLIKDKTISAGVIINCAGLYADRVAKSYGFGEKYTILPFKGVYLKYSGNDLPIKTNIYPVPKLENPFLGVHYTLTVDNTLKIGPTAIPAFWRENYKGFDNFKIDELVEILYLEAKLFLLNSFGFRSLALEEFKKYSKEYLRSLAQNMVKQIDKEKFDTWSTPGIRAQLLNRDTLELVQDFIVEADSKTIHILNAVSPAFTCSFAFSEWIIDEYVSHPNG